MEPKYQEIVVDRVARIIKRKRGIRKWTQHVCPRGHILSENRVRYGRHLDCRLCINERARLRYHKKKASEAGHERGS